MASFLVKRFLLSISTMVFISMIVFVIIQLPESDYIESVADQPGAGARWPGL